ncbi:GH3 domain-containing protein-like [Haliotis rubra]|uniref:GH3 domain-containing protein-like n=1 Tax=Haliotis rubra TaxID=36100 RepID=UPI001EE5D69B|nr:GH3 domain-containing protein-like [Haliotis rubra]
MIIHSVHKKRQLFKIPNIGKLKFWLDVRTAPTLTLSPSGVRQGPASGAGAFVCPFRPSPDVAYEIRQEQASLYVHALFGLTCKDVTLLSCLTAPTALNFFRVIETRWEAMCCDIERGNICKCPGLQDDVRLKLQKHLTADAERAGELRSIFKEGFHNIGPRTWPCLSVLHTASSGAYIPVVDIGQSYEMVITNWSGLYRYRTGDIIRVTSFTGQAPSYALQQRTGDGYDKYPEFLFTEAVLKASRTWTSGTMFNYMAVGNFIVEELTGEISTTAHVYVFIELLGDGALTDREKRVIDESLQETQDRYKRCRSSGSYAPAVVVQVRPGTLEEVKKIYMKLNPDLYTEQFKYPKFIKHKDVVACLLSRRVKSTS